MNRFRAIADYAGLVGVIVLLIALFGFSTQYFFTLDTFRNIANQIPDALVVATGMTLVLISGGIDLSVGSVIALSGAVLGVCSEQLHWPLPLAIMACLTTGLLCGLVNGMVIVRWGLPSFIVTLGMLEMASGAAYLVTRSNTIYISANIESFSAVSLFGFSLPFLIAMLIVIVGHIVLTRTVFGRHLLALGANTESARLSGIRTIPITVAVFAASGLMAGVAGFFQCIRLNSANPNAGIGFELQAIAAVVIGGTSLMGGRGSVINSFFGVLIIAILGVGLFTLGAQDSTKRLVTGAVIVAAVILDYYRHRIWKK